MCPRRSRREASRAGTCVEAKGIPVHVLGSPQKKPERTNRTPDPEPLERRGLPD